MESMRHNSFKAEKFLKTGVHGKYILVSSRAKFTGLLYLKLMLIWLIKKFYFDLVLSICPSEIIHYFLTGPLLQKYFGAPQNSLCRHLKKTNK